MTLDKLGFYQPRGSYFPLTEQGLRNLKALARTDCLKWTCCRFQAEASRIPKRSNVMILWKDYRMSGKCYTSTLGVIASVKHDLLQRSFCKRD